MRSFRKRQKDLLYHKNDNQRSKYQLQKMFGKSHKNLCIHKESSFSPYKRALTSPHDWWIHTRVSEKRAAQGGKGRTRSLFEQRLKKRKTSRACFPAITKVSHDQESSVCQFIHAFPLFLREAEKTHSQKLMGRKKILPRKKNNMFRNQARAVRVFLSCILGIMLLMLVCGN